MRRGKSVPCMLLREPAPDSMGADGERRVVCRDPDSAAVLRLAVRTASYTISVFVPAEHSPLRQVQACFLTSGPPIGHPTPFPRSTR